jgi:hypothetical protein
MTLGPTNPFDGGTDILPKCPPKSSLRPYDQLWRINVQGHLWIALTRSSPLTPSQETTHKPSLRPYAQPWQTHIHCQLWTAPT